MDSMDLPATLRAAAVGLGIWTLAAAVVCRFFWAMKQLGGDNE